MHELVKTAVSNGPPGTSSSEAATLWLRLLVALLLFASSSEAMQTWPPAGPNWPAENMGGAGKRTFRYDEKYMTAGQQTHLDTASSTPFGKALDILDAFRPVTAQQIRDAHANFAVGFYAIAPGQGRVGATNRAPNAVIYLVLEGRSTTAIAGTLWHEWEHMRHRCGWDDGVEETTHNGTPVEHAVESGPCPHSGIYVGQMQLMAAIALFYYLAFLPPPVSCADYSKLQAKCQRSYNDCIAEGGTPSGDCSEAPSSVTCYE